MGLSPELLAALHSAGLAIEVLERDVATWVEPPMQSATGWFAGTTVEGLGAGCVGPYDSPERALVAGVHMLVRLADIAGQERVEANAALALVREENEALHTALAAAQAELRAERAAKGRA